VLVNRRGVEAPLLWLTRKLVSDPNLVLTGPVEAEAGTADSAASVHSCGGVVTEDSVFCASARSTSAPWLAGTTVSSPPPNTVFGASTSSTVAPSFAGTTASSPGHGFGSTTVPVFGATPATASGAGSFVFGSTVPVFGASATGTATPPFAGTTARWPGHGFGSTTDPIFGGPVGTASGVGTHGFGSTTDPNFSGTAATASGTGTHAFGSAKPRLGFGGRRMAGFTFGSGSSLGEEVPARTVASAKPAAAPEFKVVRCQNWLLTWNVLWLWRNSPCNCPFGIQAALADSRW
jgi:hypothetical protein